MPPRKPRDLLTLAHTLSRHPLGRSRWIHVGNIREPFVADDTGYGLLETIVRRESGEVEAQLLEFLQFSKDWNARAKEHPPSADEFDRFDHIVHSGKWRVTKRSEVVVVQEAPVLFPGDELSLTRRR